MLYYKESITKDNRLLILKSADKADAEAYIEYFNKAHSETDYLTTYPDENHWDVEKTGEEFEEKKTSQWETEICAFVDDRLIGSAGIEMVRNREKTRHRAEFGISIVKAYWGLGIGNELTKACIEIAKEAGYLQLELEVVSENHRAIDLYRKYGFIEYGRNPRAFRTRQGKWQELVLMRLELD